MDHSKRNHDRIVVFLSLSFLLLLLWPEISLAEAQTPPDGRTEQYDYNNNFSPSMAIIIVVLVAALFFMGFFSIWIRHCSDGSLTSVGGGSLLNGAAGRSLRATRGLDASVIETFPTLVYSAVKGLKIGKEALECAVCLNEFEDDETLRLIPKCDHVFHPECIDTWLQSHTTCPVCRANLVPNPDEPVHRSELLDIEAQNDAIVTEPAVEQNAGDEQERPVATTAPELEVLELNKTLNRNRTRGSRSSRVRMLFPRSHSTGHSLVQPGENTERFTLRLPAEVRKEIMNRRLQRASSLVVLPREGSSRQGYRTGEGSSRGRSSRRLDRSAKSDRWVFSMTAPFLARMSSIKPPRVAANDDGEGTSASFVGPDVPRSDSVRPPV